MINLYEHQADVLKRTYQSLGQHRKTLLQAPTGGGKTVIMSKIAQDNERTGVIMPRKSLIKQTSDTFAGFNINHTYIASGRQRNPFLNTYVCSLQTISRRIDINTPPPFDVAVFDETHYSTSMIERLVQWFDRYDTRVIGLSATPWLFSGRGMKFLYNDMVQAPSVKWHIENGYLSQYKLYAPSKPDLAGIPTLGNDYNNRKLNARMEQDKVLIGNAVDYYRKLAMGRLTITYCTGVKHAYQVADIFTGAGIPAECIEGTMTEAEQEAIITRFANRQTLVLTNSDIATFGFDLASYAGMNVNIECMIDLKPTQSLSLQLQKNGRALRRKPEHAIILDHAGNIYRHGMPCKEHKWTLEDRKGTRTESAGGVKQCEECYFIYNPGDHKHCPECGCAPKKANGRGRIEIETHDGELHEIKPEDLESAADRKRREALEVEQATSLEELIAIGKRRDSIKYPAKWAAHVLQGKMMKKQRESAQGRLF